MIERYIYELDKKGISNLDYVGMDGSFYKRDMYEGAISLDEGVSLIYTKKENDEKYLVLDNFDGKSLIERTSLGDNRNYLDLYEEYKISKYGFRKKQYIYDYLSQFSSSGIYDEKLEQIRGFMNEKIEGINRTKFNVMKRVRVRKAKAVNKNS